MFRTLVTMRMYIDRKGWVIPQIAVNSNMYQETNNENTVTIIDRDIIFLTEVEEEQKARLIKIGKHCPISKILEGKITVRTFQFKEGETKKRVKYGNDEITVVWKPEFCQHAARCWKQLPEVFNYKKKHWINPNGATMEKIIEQIKACPTGALSYYLKSEVQK